MLYFQFNQNKSPLLYQNKQHSINSSMLSIAVQSLSYHVSPKTKKTRQTNLYSAEVNTSKCGYVRQEGHVYPTTAFQTCRLCLATVPFNHYPRRVSKMHHLSGVFAVQDQTSS